MKVIVKVFSVNKTTGYYDEEIDAFELSALDSEIPSVGLFADAIAVTLDNHPDFEIA